MNFKFSTGIWVLGAVCAMSAFAQTNQGQFDVSPLNVANMLVRENDAHGIKERGDFYRYVVEEPSSDQPGFVFSKPGSDVRLSVVPKAAGSEVVVTGLKDRKAVEGMLKQYHYQKVGKHGGATVYEAKGRGSAKPTRCEVSKGSSGYRLVFSLLN